MFIHAVLFEVKPKEVSQYRADSRLWASYARGAKGFVAYYTMQRFGHKNQFVSVYEWDNKACHERFMKKYHGWLVAKSKAKVKVLGYYNLKAVDRLRHKSSG
jgi:quinol monooxygenase YgiN